MTEPITPVPLLAWLGVGDDMIDVVRRIADGSLGLALIDFERSGYFEQMLAEPPAHLHTTRALADAWDLACRDDALRQVVCARAVSGQLPGAGGWRFYRARGFVGYDRGHLSGDVDRMATRLAMPCTGGPLDDVRTDFGLPSRSGRTIAAGSKTAWEPGGISP